MFHKFLAIAFLPLIPAALIIDVVIGDHVTGVETTTRQKIQEHKEAWLRMWRKPPNGGIKAGA